MNFWLLNPTTPSKLNVPLAQSGVWALAILLVFGHTDSRAADISNLGTGTASLLGGDRTDPENDGDPSAGDSSPTWNWASITAEPASDRSFEKAFRAFDNAAEGADDQWCCEDATEESPRSVTVEFAESLQLTHFTITSGNTSAGGDPQDWQISGSNDGATFVPIFTQTGDTPLWTQRNEVLLVSLDEAITDYRFFRYECTRTADVFHHIAEIEYFGLLRDEDSDEDLIPDEWERSNGLDDGLVDDGSWDADLDGLTNLAEFQRGTDPQVNPSPYLKAGEWNIHVVEVSDRPRQLESGFNRVGALDKLRGYFVTGESRHTRRQINFKERFFDDSWIFPGSIEPYPQIGEYADREDYITEVTGRFYVKVAGTYSLGFNSDDGGGLWVNGQPVAIHNQNRSRGTSVGSIELAAGLHDLRLVAWENRSASGLALFAGQTRGILRVDDVAPGTVELLQPFDIRVVATADSDGDGLDDFKERFYFGNLDRDASEDPDGDALRNGDEFRSGTSPILADTDGDGVNDASELADPVTDPTLADSDRDGSSDGLEAALGSNPTVADSDGDGFADGQEAHLGTDPSDAEKFPGSFTGVPVKVIQFTQDFDEPDGTIDLPDGSRILNLGTKFGKVDQGALLLAGTGLGGTSYVLSPMGSKPLDGFRASFRFKLNAETDEKQSAEGFSFNYVPFHGGLVGSEVNGYGRGLAFSFDARNDNNANSGYRILVDGQVVANGVVEINFPANDEWQNAEVVWTPADGASIFVNGFPVLQSIQTPGFIPCRVDRFAFAAHQIRDAGSLWIDDLEILAPADRTDSDGDGLLDVWEQTYFENLDAVGNDDPDGDTLTNTQELAVGTSPILADTDQDGLTDAVETGTGVLAGDTDSGTSPLLPDTDGDGLADGRELRVAPGSIRTDPNKYDSDGDGHGDSREILLGNSPNDTEDRPSTFAAPVYSHFDRSWSWRVENLSVVWDRFAGIPTPDDRDEETIWEFGAKNVSERNLRDAQMGLRYVQGDYAFYGHAGRGIMALNEGNDLFVEQRFSPAELNQLAGFSGWSRTDTSDRLSLEFKLVDCGSINAWAGLLEVRNQDTEAQIFSNVLRNYTTSESVQNGSGLWISLQSVPEASTSFRRGGIQILQDDPLTPGDSDDDGIADTFEAIHGMNPNDPSDALLDPDADGLLNVDEAALGTNPRAADSDLDGWNDLYELTRGYDPGNAASAPIFSDFQIPELATDLNNNGLDDLWETQIGNYNLTAAGDADGDGISNGDELANSTDPFDPDSGFVGTEPTPAALVDLPDGPAILWDAVPNARYEVLTSTDLRIWDIATTLTVQEAGALSLLLADGNPNNEPDLFFTVQAVSAADNNPEPEIDSDADGLTDEQETFLGSDPNSPDSRRQPTFAAGNAPLSGDYLAFLEAFFGITRPDENVDPPAKLTRFQSARLLEQATFGPTIEEIDRVRAMGIRNWIDNQIAQPATLHEPVIAALWQDYLFGTRQEPFYNKSIFGLEGNNATIPFMRAATQAPDQLRQRVAFALSQIIVVSRQDSRLSRVPQGTVSFYDILVRNALGNYQDILFEIAMHPVMGLYLSHIGNQKASPEINQFPDENFTRELMQLFTIGLWELNPNGERILDDDGEPISSYTNETITELARVFTGLWYAGQEWGDGGTSDFHFIEPMTMHPERHDFGAKQIFPDRFLPGRPAISLPTREPSIQNGIQDVRDAVDVLFNHPNTPPFISWQLIQFLVSANPSPEYVERVQNVFVDNGSGVRGDLGAVVTAILMDEEARDPRYSVADPTKGKLKEPVLRLTGIARAFNLGRHDKLGWWLTDPFRSAGRQVPNFSFSVFNFYRPDYQAPGPIHDANLVSPTFQITDAHSTVALPNYFWEVLTNGLPAGPLESDEPFFALDYSDLLLLSNNPTAMADRLNLLFCAGRMTAKTRAILIESVEKLPASDPNMRAILAAYIAIMCPEAAIQR